MKAAKAPPRNKFAQPWALPLALTLLCLVWWLLVLAAEKMGLPTLCAFRHLTGFPCPFCGGTRAIRLFTQFRVDEALILNPLAIGLLILLPLLLAGCAIRNSVMARLPWMKLLGTAVILNWIWLLVLYCSKV